MMKTVKCNKCGKEFLYDTVEIYNSNVVIGGEEFELSFFVCPHCHTIYRVALMDRICIRLKRELDIAKERIRKNSEQANGDIVKAKRLHNKMMQKLHSYKLRMGMLKNTYTGTFEFAASKNNANGVKIIYRESTDNKTGGK